MPEGEEHADLTLPNGHSIRFSIKTSAKARSLRLKLSARHGMTVVVPRGLQRDRLLELVGRKTGWIQQRLEAFAAVRHLISSELPARPEAFDLPALAESWRVEYKPTRSRLVGASTHQPGRIVVSGAVEDTQACHAALRRWLARHAILALSPWLSNLSEQFGIHFDSLTVKNQRTRWGSCSAKGRISLNCKLLFLLREQVRYVILHELCHLLEPSHSERFWMHLRSIEPTTDSLHGQMRDAWKAVPAWAQRGSGLLL
jgi:hypothetical protein